MIEKGEKGYVLYCDICQETAETFDTFNDAVEGRIDLGWISKRNGRSEWLDICPNCQKGGKAA